MLVAILCVSVCGCATDTRSQAQKDMQERLDTSAMYPLYESLTEEDQEIYVNICAAAESFSESAVVARYDNKTACEDAIEKFNSLYRQIFFEQSENFWIDPYNFNMRCLELNDEYQLLVNFEYLIDEETAYAKKEIFENKINQIVTAAKAKTGTFEKVLYVHDYILENAAYDYALVESDNFKTVGINAYGCLIEGKTICSGYTLAFDAIMKRLGFECGVEFNSYNTFSILTGHVWNYCKLDGEYYYFDLTWNDTGFDTEAYTDYLDYSHMYFAVTRDELSQTSYTLSPDAPTPACNGTKYNYYIYNGFNIPQYSFEAASSAVSEQLDRNYIVLRFDSYSELLKAERDLLTEGNIHNLAPEKKPVKYIIANSNLHLYIFFEN